MFADSIVIYFNSNPMKNHLKDEELRVLKVKQLTQITQLIWAQL